ncbi:MAG: IS200/IS605 family transposase [Candidatus Cloacimonetes bacterium]|jgi:putative transposase|nr:IS200/IS605 family transposase [Candidatus Cloacimonadota bacterium]
MPFIKIWIHLIWATKNRQPYLTKEIRTKVFSHIRDNAKEKGIHLDFINGYKEHIHILLSMHQEQSIAKIVHLLKGESSHWINENKLTKYNFNWQEEYLAASISHSAVNRVREYIKNQDEHHRIKSFTEEYKLFMEKYGFEIMGK